MRQLIDSIKANGVEVGTKLSKEFSPSLKDFINLQTTACAYPELGFSKRQLENGNYLVTVKKLER